MNNQNIEILYHSRKKLFFSKGDPEQSMIRNCRVHCIIWSNCSKINIFMVPTFSQGHQIRCNFWTNFQHTKHYDDALVVWYLQYYTVNNIERKIKNTQQFFFQFYPTVLKTIQNWNEGVVKQCIFKLKKNAI